MEFILEQLGQLAMVIVIMACALVGTIGIIKLIKHFSKDGKLPKDPIAKKLEEIQK